MFFKKRSSVGGVKMRLKLNRKITLCSIVVVTIIVIFLRVYNNCERVPDWLHLQTGINNILWTLSLMKTSYKRLETFRNDGRNVTRIINPLIIYWTSVFGRTVKAGDNSTWPYFSIETSCPVKCDLSSDHSLINQASAIIIHARNIEEMPAQDKIRNKKIRWILHSNESPKFTPALSSEKIMARFHFYMSYRLDSDFPLSLFRQPLLRPLPLPFKMKRSTIAVALYSHCEAVRTKYLVKLMKEIEIDSYGSCLHNTDLNTDLKQRDDQHFSQLSTPLINLYKTYKFTLVFMNSDCDHFVDEKLFYALSAGSVPVFMGTRKIRDFLPGNLNNSIIDVRDFATPRLLAQYLKHLAHNETAYTKYLRWKYQGFNFPKSFKNSSIGRLWDHRISVFCRMCKTISSGSLGTNGIPVEQCTLA